MMISEDGAGVPGANSYATTEAFRAYHELRGEFVGFPESEIVAGLVKATDYIEANYRAPKARLSPEQGLQWPIEGATAVPAPVVNATLTLALYALNGPLMAPAERGTSKSTKKLEGVGELTTEYDAAPADPYPHVSAMLAGVIARDTGGALIMGQLTR
ncbi:MULTISPECIES: DnaT-like ssDNA-binding protein [Sphingomonas]|uniref:DnaT-like ssDNA-binding protein n=1 Tax=Sphingomonas TaxID=13687 RepID=UPI000F7D858C|nr:DnaT-like ssDNA-binding protein [Sphingomonas sp. ABOLF]RSV14637.1 hypothetical protein CA235_11195 [Sphingomonas sp. ABOLF]GLK19239.1 hypothetical protein GCM10017606_00650 [Microbacterium terregens]